ncbi:polyprenyl synthetase family protein [Sulfitobacter mediterraneus]|uniref:polyprenyl synthetase family protein n=1 Tax=Sulfitobacter mediterraneus TaxID=83219 RepID=UPI0019347C77|nr:polyprenyl synthetase family protein [Sulfitobacter mediterraneus]MBM1309900.1 polyprenyl synthetase family protein [Sulfitobacter mediterraneus]MBM1313785.1 polyprenyl synthetase family protein [Sulfitobacter mediterraneus]MBM1322169.1 polyprenyl synthetase family protein [Sulfitobacter mediterraneus]MBM1326056.1 polyprenyl synthetase family protein [Sulfitobacter mediterraneus]MBM1397402.1 polyprenyl synthetase family protein [Sulfitobacter mediterraneus]
MNASGIDTVTPLLEEYGALTRTAMSEYLPKREPRQYLYDPLADYPTRGGKMMRPALCIATACAFGAAPDRAAKAAAAIEMLHNALLIHDDIEDESEERRGKPTLHMLHGTPIALNAGDALAMLSLRPMLDNARMLPPPVALNLLHDMERMARFSAEGQAMELGWRANPDVSVTRNDYLQMVLKKTCWLAAIFPCRVGAMLGKANGRQVAQDAFIRFGYFFGAAFQIHDDVLNLKGGKVYGKESCGDLWEAKRTLMLIDIAGQLTGTDKARFDQFMAQPREERDQADVEWLLARMQDSGAIDRAFTFSQSMAGAAIHEFGRLFEAVPDSRDKTFIRDLVTWTFRRDH